MIKNEGIKSLYGGIGPGLQRQCVYASIRIGFYDSLKEFYAKLFSMSKYQCSDRIVFNSIVK